MNSLSNAWAKSCSLDQPCETHVVVLVAASEFVSSSRTFATCDARGIFLRKSPSKVADEPLTSRHLAMDFSFFLPFVYCFRTQYLKSKKPNTSNELVRNFSAIGRLRYTCRYLGLHVHTALMNALNSASSILWSSLRSYFLKISPACLTEMAQCLASIT
jgi:hypothetical protein